MSHNNGKNSQVNVPFSWEHKPGVSKVTHQEITNLWHIRLKTLPPPPCPSSKSTTVSFDDPQLPFSLSATKGSFKNQFKEEADPFMVAYKKCTDQNPVNGGKLASIGKISEGRKKMRRQSVGARTFSCKHSCVVANDNLVRMSQISRPVMKEKERDIKE
ncbi:hypothetical protein JCGZ_15991 [Jatropha curcas]|uniref:Uncharacterized protein n=1 Tax=Jatropha curcas TaxID=180498 RepID=A0A067LBV3_JATCU|nr:hypothetical protein JCGZ_15991 [Jatropha curcas]